MVGRNVIPQPGIPSLTVAGGVGITLVAGCLRKFDPEDGVN